MGMAFFGLTQLGYQDTIREHTVDPPVHVPHAFRSGLFRDPEFRLPVPDYRRKTWRDTLPQDYCYFDPRPDPTCNYGSGHENSLSEYQRLNKMHILNPKGPNEIYRIPPTSSTEIGKWMKTGLPVRKTLPWAHVQRIPFVYSEMSRFRDVSQRTYLYRGMETKHTGKCENLRIFEMR